MSKSSIVMLPNTQGQLNMVGDKVRADGWYGYTDGLHTVALYLVNFTGRIYFEASIANDPTDDDWFPVQVDGVEFMEFPQNPGNPTGSTGDTKTIGRNLVGSFTWLRVGVDRSYLPGTTENDAIYNTFGYVDRVLMNN